MQATEAKRSGLSKTLVLAQAFSDGDIHQVLIRQYWQDQSHKLYKQMRLLQRYERWRHSRVFEYSLHGFSLIEEEGLNLLGRCRVVRATAICDS